MCAGLLLVFDVSEPWSSVYMFKYVWIGGDVAVGFFLFKLEELAKSF